MCSWCCFLYGLLKALNFQLFKRITEKVLYRKYSRSCHSHIICFDVQVLSACHNTMVGMLIKNHLYDWYWNKQGKAGDYSIIIIITNLFVFLCYSILEYLYTYNTILQYAKRYACVITIIVWRYIRDIPVILESLHAMIDASLYVYIYISFMCFWYYRVLSVGLSIE